MAEPEKLERLNVQLKADMRNRLNDLADQTGKSVADIIRMCIEEGLDAVKHRLFADPEIRVHVERQQRLAREGRDMLRLAQTAPNSKK